MRSSLALCGRDKNMRLTDLETEVIKKAIYSLDQHAEIYLFGSRVDERLKGGDIDLLIISKNLRFDGLVKSRHPGESRGPGQP